MIRAAVYEGAIDRDPYRSKDWQTWPPCMDERPTANPFTPDERDLVLRWFADRTYLVSGKARKIAGFYGWVAVQFLAALSPSEASGLRVRDLLLERRTLLVRRSRDLGEYGPTKTVTRRRSVEMSPRLAEILQPFATADLDAPLFPNSSGTPVMRDNAHWPRALRELGIAARGIYCAKDTWVSVAIMARRPPEWIEKQTGVDRKTLRDHYAAWYPAESDRQHEEIRRFERRLPKSEPALTQIGHDADEKKPRT